MFWFCWYFSYCKKAHKSLYYDFFTKEEIAEGKDKFFKKEASKYSNYFAWKITDKDFLKNYPAFKNLLNIPLYNNNDNDNENVEKERASLLKKNNNHFFLPIFSSLLVKDFYDFKMLRSNNFDVSIFFSKLKFEEILFFWFTNQFFFYKLLQHCVVHEVSFPAMDNLLGHYFFLTSSPYGEREFGGIYYAKSVNNALVDKEKLPKYAKKTSNFISDNLESIGRFGLLNQGKFFFYQVKDNYFNIFHRDKIVMILFFNFIFRLKKY